ncbi:MAG: tetratricopeptide repeat protein [Planctomycetales bacterium]
MPPSDSRAASDPPREASPPPGGRGWSRPFRALARGLHGGRRARFAAGAAVAGLLVGGWFLFRDDEPSPAELQRHALALLDEADDLDRRGEALDVARRLEALDYRDPEFAGALPFIQGIVAFRDARDLEESQRERQYLIAERMLRECESRALVAERRAEWAFALGMSLHRVGKASEARPLLEEALRSWGPGRLEAAASLTDIYLDLKTPEILAEALALNEGVVAHPALAPAQRDRAYLQRAQILLGLERGAEAEDILRTQVSDEASSNLATIVFRGRTMMAERKYREALELLKPVAADLGLEQSYPRQAMFLMGLCATELEDTDAAVNYFERTAEKYPRSHEGLAASFRCAVLLRKSGRHEESLGAYQRALEQVRRTEDFRNRWLDLDEFRNEILEAWNGWVEGGAFEEAIGLARLMAPLFPETQAAELAARANQRWAEELEREFASASFAERIELARRLRARWRLSGEAFAELARLRRASAEYGEALWMSAEHFRHGHDFEMALEQVTRFINTRPPKLLSVALVRRGETLFDLNRLDDALAHFQRVVDAYPSSPVAFEAAYAIGACHLERNDVDAAERAWRELLASQELTPAAKEWRNALFSLGRLMYHRAALAEREARSVPAAEELDPTGQAASASEAFDRWAEASRRLGEFAERYPEDSRAVEARYLLARSLQHSAELPRRRLRKAETENARREEFLKMQRLLQRAKGELAALLRDLTKLDETGSLDDFGDEILRNVYFELGHNAYAMENHEEALAHYAIASNHYPQAAQVLVAYIQMTNCYDRLHRPDEARSMIEQAKVIINGMPDRTFEDRSTNMTRAEWQDAVERLRRLHRAAWDDAGGR